MEGDATLTPEQQRFLQAQRLMLTTQTTPPLHWRSATQPRAIPATTNAKAKRRRQKADADPMSLSFVGTQKTAGKTVHVLQKEQRNELVDQVRLLEEHVELLRQHAGLPTKADCQEIADRKVQNVMLEEGVHANRRFVTQTQSLVAEQLQSPPVNPLSTYIHLPRDQAQRREILRGMRYVKLRRAAEIGIERFRHLDATTSYMSEERFTTEDGVYHCNRWEMNEFAQFKSAKQMYEALLFWIYNIEISVTEMVNQLTVRENAEEIEPTVWNHRMVSFEPAVGVTEELNIVGFALFYEHHELLDGAPLGIIICDSVDEDDLYPHKPEKRTRKAVQNYHLFCEEVDPRTQRKSVVLKSCTLNAQIPAAFPLDPKVVDSIHRNMSRWLVLMNMYLSDYKVSDSGGGN